MQGISPATLLLNTQCVFNASHQQHTKAIFSWMWPVPKIPGRLFGESKRACGRPDGRNQAYTGNGPKMGRDFQLILKRFRDSNLHMSNRSQIDCFGAEQTPAAGLIQISWGIGEVGWGIGEWGSRKKSWAPFIARYSLYMPVTMLEHFYLKDPVGVVPPSPESIVIRSGGSGGHCE